MCFLGIDLYLTKDTATSIAFGVAIVSLLISLWSARYSYLFWSNLPSDRAAFSHHPLVII